MEDLLMGGGIGLQSLTSKGQTGHKNPKINDVDPNVKSQTVGISKDLFDETWILIVHDL